MNVHINYNRLPVAALLAPMGVELDSNDWKSLRRPMIDGHCLNLVNHKYVPDKVRLDDLQGSLTI